MKKPDRVADYELLFEKLEDGVAELESDVTIQYRESINVSEGSTRYAQSQSRLTRRAKDFSQ